jgi:hypothetical protein
MFLVAGVVVALTVVIVVFFDWVPTPLNRNIAGVGVPERLPSTLVHAVVGVFLAVAAFLSWRWVVLAGAIWYTVVLIVAVLNWWVPWVTGHARGEISPDDWRTEYSRNVRVLPALRRSTIIPDVQHTLIHVAVLASAVACGVAAVV